MAALPAMFVPGGLPAHPVQQHASQAQAPRGVFLAPEFGPKGQPSSHLFQPKLSGHPKQHKGTGCPRCPFQRSVSTLSPLQPTRMPPGGPHYRMRGHQKCQVMQAEGIPVNATTPEASAYLLLPLLP